MRGLVLGIVGMLAGYALVFGAPKFLRLPYAGWAVLVGLFLVILFSICILFWTIVYVERLTERKKRLQAFICVF